MSFQDKLKPVATSTPGFQQKLRPVQSAAPATTTTPTVEPEKTDGFFKSVVRAVAAPVTKTLSSLQTVPEAAFAAVSPNFSLKDVARRNVEGRNYGFFGENVRPFGAALQEASEGKRTATSALVQTSKELAGNALNVASTIVPVGKLPAVARATVAGRMMQGARVGALSGAASGAAGAGGAELAEEGSTMQSVGTQALLGGAGGAAFGGILGGVAPVVARVVSPTVRANTTVTRRTATLTDLQKKYPKVQAAFEQGQRKGIDVQKTLAETNLLNGAVDENGLVKTDRAIENFNEFIAPLEGKVREVIKKEGRRISLDTIARNMDDFVAKTKMESGAYQKLTNELLSDLRGLQAKYGNQIPVEALHDTKIFRGSANNYMDTGANAINKEATRFYKDIVEQNVPSLDVAGYNRELSKYYAVRDALEALDGKRVQGGRLGTYFSSVIGSGVGGLAGGPLGAIVGAEAGARASGVQMASRFGSDLSKGLTVTDEMARMSAERTGRAAIPDVVLPRRTAPVGDVVVPKVSDFFEPLPLMQQIKNSLKDQTGSIRNPLGKGETALQRTARLRESSAKINRLNTKALDVMEDYVNYFDGQGVDVRLPSEQIKVGGDVIAKELGFTERGKALADRFREVLDARMDKGVREAKMINPTTSATSK